MDECSMDPKCKFLGIVQIGGEPHRQYACDNNGQETIKNYPLEDSDDGPAAGDEAD